jgi:glycosyltransferase involved in cell wall biosynthesis
MMLRYAAGRPDVRLEVVNTAPRWRAIHDMSVVKRAIGGGLQLVRDLAKLTLVIARKRPDVIHLTTSGQLAVVRDLGVIRAARLLGVPVVYHVRFGRVPQIAEARTREWRLMRLAMLEAAAVIAIDEKTEEAIRRHAPGAHVALVPNCINLAELPYRHEQARGSRVAMFLGWTIPTKGVEDLVAAWGRLRPEGWRLVLAGPGDPDYHRRLLDAHGVVEGIEFCGELSHSDALRTMSDAEVFVLPSHTEGFPNVILEAMALGKAIIATRVGAIPEMLAEETGIVIPARDVGALAGALGRVIGDATLRAQLGLRAQQRASHQYSISSVFARYLDMWRSAAADGGRKLNQPS